MRVSLFTQVVARRCALAALAVGVASTATAEIRTYTATLDGPSESPPNASPATGSATVDYNTVTKMMRVRADFMGLIGNTTVAHIHSATALPGVGTVGVATPPTLPGFPVGVTSGMYDFTLDMTVSTSFNASFITGNGGTVDSARAALFEGMDTGRAYFNLHTSAFGGGEIRGFLAREGATIPLPTPALMGLAGLGAVTSICRRRS